MSEQGNLPKMSASPELKKKLGTLYLYIAKRLGIQHPPLKIVFTKSKKNADKPFGLTAYYEQESKTVRLYITDRHETDILRSFAHEIIHHWQNERGTLIRPSSQEGYAQNDSNLRKREMEAYLFGNILFRDWQDEHRYGAPKVQPFLPQPINENLELKNGLKTAIEGFVNNLANDRNNLTAKVKEFVENLVTNGVLSSYHRKLTSGDMKPEDFKEDLEHKIISVVQQCDESFNVKKMIHSVLNAIREWIQTINNRGNWENQSNMIK